MDKYPKIQTLYKRSNEGPAKNPIIFGDYSRPEFALINEWQVTEKVDGMNIRIHYDGKRVVFGGRDNNSLLPAPLVNILVQRFTPGLFVSVGIDWPCTLYGEGYGPGIQQGGAYGLIAQDFILFDVNIGGYWLNREDVEDVGKKLGTEVVPLLVRPRWKTRDIVDYVKQGFISAVAGNNTIPHKTVCDLAEGVVARSPVELTNKLGERVMWKLKHKDFPPSV